LRTQRGNSAFSGGGINNLNEEEMGTPTQEIEEILLKRALSSQQQKQQRLGHEGNRKENED
jgi:hypothetical protein